MLGAKNCIALVKLLAVAVQPDLNVNTPNFGCYNGEFWAVSQAASDAPGPR